MVATKSGDAITLVSEMLNIKPFEAAVFLNNNLGLGVEIKKNQVNKDAINKYNEKRISRETLKKWEINTFVNLTNKYHELEKYNKAMSKKFENEPDLYFQDENIVKFLQNKEIIKETIDEMLEITEDKEILKFKKTKGKVVELLYGKR